MLRRKISPCAVSSCSSTRVPSVTFSSQVHHWWSHRCPTAFVHLNERSIFCDTTRRFYAPIRPTVTKQAATTHLHRHLQHSKGSNSKPTRLNNPATRTVPKPTPTSASGRSSSSGDGSSSSGRTRSSYSAASFLHRLFGKTPTPYTFGLRFYGLVSRQWFILSIPFLIFLSGYNCDILRSGGHLHFDKLKTPTVMAILFSTGLTIPLDCITAMLSLWQVHLFVHVFGFLCLPFVFSAIGDLVLRRLCGVPDSVIAGWDFISCLPTTISTSITLTTMSRGATEVALFNCALSNFLGIFATPWCTERLTGLLPSMETDKILRNLTKMVLLPAFAGIALRWACPAIGHFDWILKKLPAVMLMPVIGSILSDTVARTKPGERNHHRKTLYNVACVAVTCAGTNVMLMFSVYRFLTMLRLKQFNDKTCIAVSYMCSQKTAIVGIPILTLLFPAGQVDVIPLVLYHAIQAVTGSLFSQYFRRK